MISTARAAILLIIYAQFLLIPRISSAETDVSSKTYLKFYTDAWDEKYAPLYEYLELQSRDRQQGLWNFYLSGWWGRDFSTVQDDKRTRDDLTNAFVSISPYQNRKLVLTAGRHYVFEGVAAEKIDGLSGRWEITPERGVSLFGGVPVETEFDNRKGDSTYGGRIYQRILRKAEIGFSFFNEDNNRSRYRQEAGVDLWALPIKSAEIKGHSYYNTITEGWGEHAYTLRLFPAETVVLSGSYSRTNYGDAFSAHTLSVFSPEFLGKDEQLTKKGGSIEYRFGADASGVLDYVNYSYNTMGAADYFGGKVSRSIAGISSGISLHRMNGAVEKLRYTESRIYGVKDGEAWRFSLDALNLHYDLPVNGIGDAYWLNGAIRYAISPSLSAACSVDYGKTPEFDYTTTALLTLVYNFKGGE